MTIDGYGQLWVVGTQAMSAASLMAYALVLPRRRAC
jgi:hypothetical protein